MCRTLNSDDFSSVTYQTASTDKMHAFLSLDLLDLEPLSDEEH